MRLSPSFSPSLCAQFRLPTAWRLPFCALPSLYLWIFFSQWGKHKHVSPLQCQDKIQRYNINRTKLDAGEQSEERIQALATFSASYTISVMPSNASSPYRRPTSCSAMGAFSYISGESAGWYVEEAKAELCFSTRIAKKERESVHFREQAATHSSFARRRQSRSMAPAAILALALGPIPGRPWSLGKQKRDSRASSTARYTQYKTPSRAAAEAMARAGKGARR